MLSNKRNRSKIKEEDTNTENALKNNKNENEKEISEIPLEEENEKNNKTKKGNKENKNKNKKSVKGRRKKQNNNINNTTIHNDEVHNNNTGNENDKQSMGNQINNNNILENDNNNNKIHTSLNNTQNNFEGNNIDNNNQNQNTNKLINRIYVTPNPEDYEISNNQDITQVVINNAKNYTIEKLKKAKSCKNISTNANINISMLPNNCDIFKKFELFNSMLLIINNISLIKNYFSNNEVIELIKKCEKNNKYCLSSISYHINKYLWDINNKKEKSQKILLEEYNNFVKVYSSNNCKDNNPDLYCYNINNLEYIINFIYYRINVELTNSNDKKKLYKSQNNDPLSKYSEEFSKKYHSIISDHFIGTYLNKIICQRCKNTQYSYEPFMTISFNIKNIYNYLYNNFFGINFNIFKYNNSSKYIKLNDCFIYLFNNCYNNYNSFCENCNGITDKKQTSSIFALPNILTLILTDNNDNDFFMLEDEIDLKNYVLNQNEEKSYNLISILCRISYNGKFIIYCINPNNSLWYSYTDGNISLVDKMDLNSIPLMLVYQIKSEISFIYRPIKRETNKIKFYINFSNGITSTNIYFNKNEIFKDLYEKISSYFNLKDKKFILIINGKTIMEGQNLNEFINNNNNGMLVYFN